MRYLIRALSAETLKLRRSLALWLAILAPLSMSVLQGLAAWQRAPHLSAQPEAAWAQLLHSCMIYWALLLMPLFIPLETALLAGLDHNPSQWRRLYALPLPRWTIYAAKQIMSMLLIGLCLAVMAVSILGVGFVLRIVIPKAGFGNYPPWQMLFRYSGYVFLASWLLIAIHTLVAMRWSNFVVAIGFGIIACVAAVMIVQSEYGPYYPWAMPGIVGKGLDDGTLATGPLLAGMIGGLILPFFAAPLVTRRDVL